MGKYFDSLNDEVKEYFKILSPDYPEWIEDYIAVEELQHEASISMSCGTDYSKCFNLRYWYSNLDHSVGVALIIWNFTHDKKQTIASLFHDIATPVFKHCIDFMNGDAEHQESTEENTIDIIKNSKAIKKLLDRDNIKLEDVCDYKIYPLADNDSPKLSADRFEYTFSSGLSFYKVWELDIIKKIYNNIAIGKNEDSVDELVFKDKDVCEEYISIASKLWPRWVRDENRTVMQFLADMCKSLNVIGKLSIDDLYTLTEKEVIEKFKNCGDKYLENAWENFSKTDKVFKSDKKVTDKYCVNVTTKTRYVNPLVLNMGRIYDISETAHKQIDEYLAFPKGGYYIGFEFDFKPYE